MEITTLQIVLVFIVACIAGMGSILDVLIHLKYEKKPGGHWIIRDLMGLDLVGLASL
ncbi:hypothetical protein NKM15_001256 [Escherichia coli]|nr:hypothetical protein [Escherichia coli]